MSSIVDVLGTTATTTKSDTLASAESSDIMGKQDFLTLLVAQLQNQDPLNPDDPTDFTAQLAQFSSLEQLFNLNESMELSVEAQKQSDRFATMDLIGKDVSYAGDAFAFIGEPASIGYQVDGSVNSVVISIKDSNGNTVSTMNPTNYKEGNHYLEWDGLDKNGEQVAAGNYTVSVQAVSNDSDLSVAVKPLVQSVVSGVTFNDDTGDAVIHTLAGAEIETNAILAIHDNRSVNEPMISREARIASSSTNTKSAPRDEDQIAMDTLQHYLAGK